MAGFILVIFFSLMVYLLSRIHSILVQLKEVFEICFKFQDISDPDYSICETSVESRISNLEEGGLANGRCNCY